MRPVAIGRKKWPFVGSERDGRAAVLFMSLVKSRKDLGINSWKYFDDKLRWILSHPLTRLRELFPDQWKERPRDEQEIKPGEMQILLCYRRAV